MKIDAIEMTALFGAFGFIAIAFIYMTAHANAMAENHESSNALGTAGFWLATIGIIGFGIPRLILGFEQGKIAHDLGYYFARTPDALNHMDLWKQISIFPDALVILSAAIIFYDLVTKIYFPKKVSS